MGITRHYLHEYHLVLSVGRGPVTDADLLEHVKALNSDIQHLAGYRQIADCRIAMDNPGISGIGLYQAARLEARRPREARLPLAIVAPDDLIHRWAMIYASVASLYRERVEVFRSLEQATFYLGLSHEARAAVDEVLATIPAPASRRLAAHAL